MVRLRSACLLIAILSLPTAGLLPDRPLPAAEPKGAAASKGSPLDMLTTVKWDNISLEDVAEDLRKTYKLDVSVDRQSIENEGLVTTNIKIKMDFRGLTLRSILWLALDAYRLELIEGPEGLVITSRPVAQDTYFEREYDLKPLASLARDPQAVDALIRGSIEAYWKDTDRFGGALEVTPGKLKVKQISSAQIQIAALLLEIQRALTPAKRPQLSMEEANERGILERLSRPPQKKVTADGEIAINEIAGQCGQAFGMAVWLDGQGLEETGVGFSQKITPKITGTTSEEILASILGPLELDAVVRHEVLLITSRHKANAANQVAVYNPKGRGVKLKGTAAEIVRQIQESDEYGTWGTGGGVIQTFGHLIVVRQSQKAIKKLDLLFSAK